MIIKKKKKKNGDEKLRGLGGSICFICVCVWDDDMK